MFIMKIFGIIFGLLLFLYACVYDPEPPLACPVEQAILTPEQATAFAMQQWPGVQEGKEREKFLAAKREYPPEFVKYPIVTDRGKWVWVVGYGHHDIVFDKCGNIISQGVY